VKRSQSSFPTSAFLVSYGARSAASSRLEFENESVRISSTYFPITTLGERIRERVLLVRPDRSEPRATKLRPKPYQYHTKPRAEFREILHRSHYRAATSNRAIRLKYVSIRHSPAYTAQEIAESAHIPGDEMAKTVMIKVGDKLAMAVLPATEQLDASTVSRAANGADVSLATEDEFSSRLPDCEVGAMPPFGNLYDLQVYLSPKLSEQEEIAFNAGSHTELIRLAYTDFERLAQPAIVPLPA